MGPPRPPTCRGVWQHAVQPHREARHEGRAPIPAEATPRWDRSDVGVVVFVLLAGLFFWFLYVAVQPRDYQLPSGSPDRLRTLFGWRAPGIDATDPVERDRLWFAVAGWLVVGLVAGRLRPKLWMLIGPLAVLPTLLVYFATAPHDHEGWWRTFNIVYLPMAACAVSVVARLAPRLDWMFNNVLVLAGSVGMLFAASLLMGGGESPGLIIATGVGSGVLAGAVRLGGRR